MTALHVEMTLGVPRIHVTIQQEGQAAQTIDREAMRQQIRQTVDQAIRNAQASRVDAQAARAEAEAARAAGQGVITIEQPPAPPGTTVQGPTRVIVGNGIQQDVKDITAWFFITIAAILILRPLMSAFGRRLERRGAPPAALPMETAQQIARIEQTVEAMAIEVERISEGQRFAAKLLAEREKQPS